MTDERPFLMDAPQYRAAPRVLLLGLPGYSGTLFDTVHTSQPDDGLAEHLARRLISAHERIRAVDTSTQPPDAEGWWSNVASLAGMALPADITKALRRSAPLLADRRASRRVLPHYGRSRGGEVIPHELDVGHDLAFLAADLATIRPETVVDELVGRYIAGALDETIGILQPLHRALACVSRVQVAATHGARIESGAYLSGARLPDVSQIRPYLIVIGGLPGVGKSTVSGILAGLISAAYVSSDIVRKQVAGMHPRTRNDDSPRRGLYSPLMTRRTSADLRRRVDRHLASGRTVIVEALHIQKRDRAALRSLAGRRHVPTMLVEIRLTPAQTLARLRGRASDPLRVSDADSAIHAIYRDRVEPFTDDEGPSMTVDGNQQPSVLAHLIATQLGELR